MYKHKVGSGVYIYDLLAKIFRDITVLWHTVTGKFQPAWLSFDTWYLSFGFKGVSTLSASATVIIIMDKKQSIRGGENTIQKVYASGQKLLLQKPHEDFGAATLPFIQTCEFCEIKWKQLFVELDK